VSSYFSFLNFQKNSCLTYKDDISKQITNIDPFIER